MPAGIAGVERKDAREYDFDIMTHLALFVSLVLGIPSTNALPSAPQSCSLAGLWLSQNRTAEAVGMWLEFDDSGAVMRASGRIVDGEYALTDEVMTLTVRPALTQRVLLKVEGDHITRTAEAAASTGAAPKVPPVPAITVLEEQTLSRMVARQPGQPPLVGVWGYKTSAGRTVLERYSPNGRFVVFEPTRIQRGTYVVADGQLSVTADGATSAVPIACAGDAFDLEVSGGQMKFVKFQ
jgi:hypothetical protein